MTDTNVGWIKFDPSHGGVTIGADGSFDGYAWAENVGWIHFKKTTAPAYNVVTTWSGGTPPPGGTLASPTGLTATVISATRIRLSWTDNSGSETGFIIERTDNMSPWVRVTMTGADVTSFTDSTLRCSWQYSYRVLAHNADGDSEPAVIAKIITAACPPYDPLPSSISLNGGTDADCGGTITVPENQAAGTLIGNLSAEDATAGGDTHTYALFAPGGILGCNPSFSIQGNQLITRKPFDFEKKKSCRIWIQTHDAHSNLKTCHFDIRVTDVPEAPSDLQLRNYDGVREDSPAGTDVGTLVAKDDDGDDSHTYELVSGEGDTDNASFTLEGDTLRTKAAFDYEAGGASRSVLVRTTDSTGLAYTKQLSVEILDMAEAAVISRISDLGTDDEVPVTAEFTVSDQDTALSALRFSAASDSPDLLPAENIRFGGSGESRTVILTPVTGMSGAANVTVSVDDGSISTETDFVLTVTTGPELRASAQIAADTGNTVAPGGVLPYTVSISNTGDRDAEGVRFALPLPESTDYAEDTAGAVIRSVFRNLGKASAPVYDSELSQTEWIGDIGSGETAEISFDLRVRPGTETGEMISFGGTVSYDTDGDGVSDITRDTDEIGDGSADSEIRITVEGCLPGDTDASGVIDIKDAVQVIRTLSGTDTGEICPESDMNGDGKTGPEELIWILQEISK
ncbi:Fibronectin type III domain-containing protein, DUF11 [Desulfonema magnum]|uniref:Fibronectin type III domain-containing protein, DUF11 n=2 Tax=Desulfonema magnum TaxID=45655 RepID=A0A975GTT9_9BACT|nr:Fibronectin type III domain-containing protein, DUF11 [Desulfonema magnum]